MSRLLLRTWKEERPVWVVLVGEGPWAVVGTSPVSGQGPHRPLILIVRAFVQR